MKPFALQPAEIEAHWFWIEPFLQMVDDPGWSADDIRQALVSYHAQLWGWSDDKPQGVIVTRLENIGSTPYGLVWICAGREIDAALAVYRDHIEPWFREKGCKWAELVGRKGWIKVLPDYRERARVLVKDL